MKLLKTIIVLVLLLVAFFVIAINRDRQNYEYMTVDFGKKVGTVGISYGADDDNKPGGFMYESAHQERHHKVGSEYIRTWISAQSYRPSSFPLQPEGRYDFDNIDKNIDAVLNSGAIPFVVFAHYNVCGHDERDSPDPFDFSRCEGHGVPPAHNDTEFADYVQTVVEHFKDRCIRGEYSAPCDVDDWYFEIWNEPFGDEWWEDPIPRYSEMFNAVNAKIKAIAPTVKVGGPSGAYIMNDPTSVDRITKFLEHSRPDFLSLHHYGNILGATSDAGRIRDTGSIFYDAPMALRGLAKRKGLSNIEIINSEYNADSSASYAIHLDEPFVAAWYASALINQIKSKEIDLEIFYAGTSSQEDGGFGMWGQRGTLFPTYYMKRIFVEINKKGSSIALISIPDESLDVLAVENQDGKFITIVNKQNMNNMLALKFSSGNYKNLIDIQNNDVYTLFDNEIGLTLRPYEVRFFKVNR